jgi:hypothetical protein
MTTDIRAGLKTREEYEQSLTVSFIPSILSIPKKREISLDMDKITYKELSVEGDSVVPSFLTSEGTEINHVKVSSTSRVFNAYGKGIKLTKDNYKNSGVNVQNFHDQVIRRLSEQFDNVALAGEGGNNGLINSSDVNVLTPASIEIPAVSGDGFNRIQKAKDIAVDLNLLVNDYTASVDLTIFFYGSALLRFLGNITAGQENDVRYHIRQAFAGRTVTFVDISALSLSGISTNGIIVVSNDLVTLEHCGLPRIQNDGVNSEDDYYWSRYFFGSLNVRPEVEGAVIKQAITFAA